MSAKTIEEMKAGKLEAERQIAEVLRNFTTEFGVHVSYVNFDSIKDVCGKRDYLVNLNVEL